jgi:DNA-binding GntR family transcriptional regulator
MSRLCANNVGAVTITSEWDLAVEELRLASVNRAGGLPLWARVAAGLRTLIDSGQLPVGTRIESEVTLAERLGISRPTLRRAMQELVEAGALTRKPGVGTVVVRPAMHRPIELTSLYDDLAKAGRKPETQVLELEVVPASDAMALALRIPPRSTVTSMRRLRSTDGEPLALMYNVVPVQVARITKSELQRSGLYTLLREVGAHPSTANEVIGARAATRDEASVLGLKAGDAVLTMSRSTWGLDGRGLEYGSHIYRADRYAFEQSVSVY